MDEWTAHHVGGQLDVSLYRFVVLQSGRFLFVFLVAQQ